MSKAGEDAEKRIDGIKELLEKVLSKHADSTKKSDVLEIISKLVGEVAELNLRTHLLENEVGLSDSFIRGDDPDLPQRIV